MSLFHKCDYFSKLASSNLRSHTASVKKPPSVNTASVKKPSVNENCQILSKLHHSVCNLTVTEIKYPREFWRTWKKWTSFAHQALSPNPTTSLINTLGILWSQNNEKRRKFWISKWYAHNRDNWKNPWYGVSR